jgi:adenylate cyclase class IV
MIEVEKKFQPTKEQLQALLDDSKFIKEIELHDLYYDYPDYSLWKKTVFFRNRNGRFEVKIQVRDTGTYDELEDEESIKKYFKTDKPISEFVMENFIVAVDFKTRRRKYKKDDFNIDVDELSFGYECVEIELLVEDELQIKEAQAKIIQLAEQYDFDMKKVPPKRHEYFRLVKPDIFKELYQDK